MSADPIAGLQQLRTQMDVLNQRLVAVLQERARLCRRIAAHKRATGLPLVDVERERAMLATLLRDAGEGFSAAELERILQTVFAASRAVVCSG